MDEDVIIDNLTLTSWNGIPPVMMTESNWNVK
jgi:hypothetical protein